MAISTAERNRRKRERKKREKEKKRLEEINDEKVTNELEEVSSGNKRDVEIEVEYVTEPTLVDKEKADDDGGDIGEIMRKFQMRSAVALVSDDENGVAKKESSDEDIESVIDAENDTDRDDLENQAPLLSNRKMRELNRPTVAQLKNEVKRADLVEAHDVTAADPHFLITLKSIPGTVPVPRHWGRKRKYLQGKRGIEKLPFQLPNFIVQTGITEIRSAIAEDEQNMSIKQKNRARVAPKLGAVDVDYRTLHDAFFKYQSKPKMTKFGDLYYEGKEFETQKSQHFQPGVYSDTLRKALGMTTEGSPPPWLVNMQRHGPPPSYPNLKIPGLNAPIPEGCNYGYHVNGWGKPPIDTFGRPLYGGNPFGNPAGSSDQDGLGGGENGVLVTSDGKTLLKTFWGALPSAEGAEDDDDDDADDSSEEGSSDEDMEASDEEGEETEEKPENNEEGLAATLGAESDLPSDGVESVVPNSSLELRKVQGEETPMFETPKPLYTVLKQTDANNENQVGAVFKSDIAYVLPGSGNDTTVEGAESVLSKAVIDDTGKRKRPNTADDDEEADALGKKFKF